MAMFATRIADFQWTARDRPKWTKQNFKNVEANKDYVVQERKDSCSAFAGAKP